MKVCEKVLDIVADGKQAQKRFVEIMLQGFSEDEKECMKHSFEHIWENINSYLKEETE